MIRHTGLLDCVAGAFTPSQVFTKSRLRGQIVAEQVRTLHILKPLLMALALHS